MIELTRAIQTMEAASKGRQGTQELSPALRQRTTLVRQRYGSREQFLETFNPMLQISCARHADRAYFGDAPTLGLLRKTYGDNMATMWLMPQLYDLCEFTSVKKINEHQALYLAEIIANEYGYFKVTEFLLFFYLFKTGKYGRFYGSADPMVIMEALKAFREERFDEYRRHEQEEAKKLKLEEDKNRATISPDEVAVRLGYPRGTSIACIVQYERQKDYILAICSIISMFYEIKKKN